MLSRSYKYYWWCQIAGWGFVWLSMIFFAYTFDQKLTDVFIKRVSLVAISGIITTHALRAIIKRYNWLLQPIEKILPRLLIAIIVSSIVCSLLVIAGIEFFDLSIGKRKLDFSTRLLASTL